jgi:hypothetical protein
MKKMFAAVLMILMVASVAAFAVDGVTYTGWVVDEKCGVKGAHEGAETCAKKCIDSGMPPVLVTDSDKNVWHIQNPDALKNFAGKHVTVTAAVKDNQLVISNVAEAQVAK